MGHKLLSDFSGVLEVLMCGGKVERTVLGKILKIYPIYPINADWQIIQPCVYEKNRGFLL